MINIFKSEKKATTAYIAMWYVFANFFVKGMSVISAPIFTRLMNKSEYGGFSNFTSWESILVVILTLDLYTSISRAKYDFEGRMDEYLSSILFVSNVITFISYAIVELNINFFERIFSFDAFQIRVMFLSIMMSPAFHFLQTKHRIYRKYIFFVVFAISSALIRTVISVLLVINCEDKLMARLCGYVIPISLLNLILVIYIYIRGRKVSMDCIKYACAISIPLLPHTLSGIILGNSDRIMINNICGSEKNAIYTLVYQVSSLVSLIWTSMNNAWSPWLFDQFYAQNKELVKQRVKLYFGVFVALIVGVDLTAPELLLFFGGKSYIESLDIMPVIILGLSFVFAYSMYVSIEIYEKKTWYISAGTVVAALINIVLNYVFIPVYGYKVAAFTTLIGYVLLFAFHAFIANKISTEYYNYYSMKYNLMLLLGLAVMSFLSKFMYKYNVLRYTFVLIYFISGLTYFVKNKKTIIQLFIRKKKEN